MSERDKGDDLTPAIAALVAIAVVFAGSISVLGYRREHTEERKEIAAHDTDQDRREISVDCSPVGSGPLQCIAVFPQAIGASKASEYDLRAQQEMAEWALAVFIATVVGVGISGVGLWALFHNLDLVRQQIAQAETASKEAIKETRRIGENQSRAYIHVSAAELDYSEPSISYAILRDDSTPTHRLRLWLTFENVGDTPPKSVECAVELREEISYVTLVLGYDTPPEPYYQDVPRVYKGTPRRFEMNASFVAEAMEDLRKKPDRLIGKGYGLLGRVTMPKRIMIRGRVKYIDVFDRQSFSDFAFAGPLPKPGTKLDLTPVTSVKFAVYEDATPKSAAPPGARRKPGQPADKG